MTQRRRRTVPKRSFIWLPHYTESFVLGAAGASGVNITSRYFLEVGREIPVGTTLGPIRGTIRIRGDTVGLSPDIFSIIRLNREEDTTSPILDLESSDAMWYGQFLSNNIVQETAAGVFAVQAETYTVETHAMRKVTAVGDELRMSFDEVSGDAGVDMTIALQIFMKFP